MAKIKTCGITNIEDYDAAVSLGSDYTGFIFYEKSPRHISCESAREIVKKGMNRGQQKVGVFVNESIKNIKEIYEKVGLNIVQLHGDENPEYCSKLDLPFWKVIRVKDEKSIDAMKHFECQTFLLDTFSPQKYGGTGQSFDLQLAQKAIDTGKKIVIAGGVSPENVQVFFELSPYALDVCSSVEERPGKKNINKMKIFFDKIHKIRCKNEE